MLRSEAMGNILISLFHALSFSFRTRALLFAEILALRHPEDDAGSKADEER